MAIPRDLVDLGQRLDAVLHAQPLLHREPGALRHPEDGAQQLDEHGLPGLHGGALVGERRLEECRDDVGQSVGHCNRADQ